jgi:hypothetical protein
MVQKVKRVHLALFFKDFAVWLHSSCVGLNVAAYSTAKVLRENGIDATAFPVRHNVDVVNAIDQYNETHRERLTHVVISAPWLSERDIKALLCGFPEIQFVVLSHSNVGFLQADPDGVYILRRYLDLSKAFTNLRVGGNSERFVAWFQMAYDDRIVLLPNLYSLAGYRPSKVWVGSWPLRIGSFGAIRPLKNFMTSAGAALLIGKYHRVPVEFHMSCGGESSGNGIVLAIEEMLARTGVKLIKHEWELWDKFVQVVANMDLLIQPSYTESFNMITADGIRAGVASVVSPAIYWVPKEWQVDPDDAAGVALVGRQLLAKPAANDGRKALANHNTFGLRYWGEFLYGKVEEVPWYRKIFRRV